jgi:hypothetical protein
VCPLGDRLKIQTICDKALNRTEIDVARRIIDRVHHFLGSKQWKNLTSSWCGWF